MQTINAREARENLDRMLDAVECGEKFVILPADNPVASLTAALPDPAAFPDRSGLRASLPPATKSANQAIRALRDAERY